MTAKELQRKQFREFLKSAPERDARTQAVIQHAEETLLYLEQRLKRATALAEEGRQQLRRAGLLS